MLKLIKLEWKKNNIAKYTGYAAIMAVCLAAFIFALAFLGIANEPDGTLDAVPGTDVISAPIELFTSIAFLIFTSVMLASFIVGAYKNKTMTVMFSYPMKRQKILASQMAAVWIFNFAAITFTKLTLYLIVFLGANYLEPSFAIDFNMGSLSFYIQLAVKSVVIVSMSFIALYVGMALKSSKAVIVTSFLLIFLTQANVGDFTMAGNAVFPIILTVISVVFAILSIYNAENKDLI